MHQRVSCADGGLTSVPHTLGLTVISLDLRKNEITQIADALPPSLVTLDLSHNALTAVAAGELGDLTSLQSLDLSANLLHTVEDGVLAGLASLRSLSLADNMIEALGEEMFSGLHQLRTLNLSGNRLEEVSINASLGSLEILDLGYNRLSRLSALPGLHSLTTLVLRHNSLTHISRAAFAGLANLRLLDLSHNAIQQMDSAMFVGLPDLTRLDLSFNNITDFSNFSSPSLSANATIPIKSLDLQGNSFQHLRGRIFQRFSELQTLDVSQNAALRWVAFDALQGVMTLANLNLSLCPALTFLHPDLLAPVPGLQVLDLRGNGLTALSPVTFHSNPHLTTAFLSANPWQCSCGLAWLVQNQSIGSSSPAFGENTVSSRVADLNLLKCTPERKDSSSDPMSFSSNETTGATIPVPLSSKAAMESMQCNNISLVNVTTVVYAKIGSPLVLRCGDYRHDSDSVLTWITPRGLIFHFHPFHPEAISHLDLVSISMNLSFFLLFVPMRL